MLNKSKQIHKGAFKKKTWQCLLPFWGLVKSWNLRKNNFYSLWFSAVEVVRTRVALVSTIFSRHLYAIIFGKCHILIGVEPKKSYSPIVLYCLKDLRVTLWLLVFLKKCIRHIIKWETLTRGGLLAAHLTQSSWWKQKLSFSATWNKQFPSL